MGYRLRWLVGFKARWKSKYKIGAQAGWTNANTNSETNKNPWIRSLKGKPGQLAMPGFGLTLLSVEFRACQAGPCTEMQARALQCK